MKKPSVSQTSQSKLAIEDLNGGRLAIYPTSRHQVLRFADDRNRMLRLKIERKRKISTILFHINQDIFDTAVCQFSGDVHSNRACAHPHAS